MFVSSPIASGSSPLTVAGSMPSIEAVMICAASIVL
jgi:hypothetical protein